MAVLDLRGRWAARHPRSAGSGLGHVAKRIVADKPLLLEVNADVASSSSLRIHQVRHDKRWAARPNHYPERAGKDAASVPSVLAAEIGCVTEPATRGRIVDEVSAYRLEFDVAIAAQHIVGTVHKA